MKHLRKIIRNIINENTSFASNETEIQNIISSYDATAFGYRVLSVVKETTSTESDLVYTIALQHVKPDFGCLLYTSDAADE